MTLYVPDVSEFQGAVDWQQVRAEGFAAAICRIAYGANHPDEWWPSNRDGARAAGLPLIGYFYLLDGDADGQAATVARLIGDKSIPIMLDWEADSGDIHNLWNVWQAIEARGMRVALVYAPHWYWQRAGSPDLTGLPPIVASNYVSGSGYASSLYGAVASGQWGGYGGQTPALLQFTDSAHIAGYVGDCSAFEGDESQLAALIGAASHQEDDMQADERQALMEVRAQLTGSETPGEYPGWPSFVDSSTSFTDTDFLRWIDANTNTNHQAVMAQLAALQTAVSALATQSGSPVTAEQLEQMINDAVAEHVQITGTVSISGAGGSESTSTGSGEPESGGSA